MVLALDRFDEARAVLAMADLWRVPQVRPAIITARGDSMTETSPASSRIVAVAHVDSTGRWHPGYRELSVAVAKREADRTDWERRTIAAARWFHRACETRWYTEALVDLVIALECLFVAPHEKQGNGPRIAHRATAVCLLPEHDVKSQRKWIGEMYTRRNDVAHEGFSISQDLDVEELITLVNALVQWGAWHLTTMHHEDEQPCTSIEQVLDLHITPLLTRDRTRNTTSGD